MITWQLGNDGAICPPWLPPGPQPAVSRTEQHRTGRTTRAHGELTRLRVPRNTLRAMPSDMSPVTSTNARAYACCPYQAEGANTSRACVVHSRTLRRLHRTDEVGSPTTKPGYSRAPRRTRPPHPPPQRTQQVVSLMNLSPGRDGGSRPVWSLTGAPSRTGGQRSRTKHVWVQSDSELLPFRPCGAGPGRPKGSTSDPAQRHPAIKKAAQRQSARVKTEA